MQSKNDKGDLLEQFGLAAGPDDAVDSDGILRPRNRGPIRTQEPKPIKTADKSLPRQARLQRMVRYRTGERNQITVFLDPDVYKALCQEADTTGNSINEIIRLRMRYSYGISPEYVGISLKNEFGRKSRIGKE